MKMSPVEFTLIRNSLELIVDEMTLTMVRTAYSANIREAMDFSVAICSSNGEMIAQGPCLAVHLGAIPAAIEAMLDKFGGSIEPGDVFMLNDPYTGGMHLPDIFLFKPIFGSSGLLAFLVIVADHVDVGGSVPGSRGVASKEIYAEGLRIPPVRLYRQGTEVSDMWDLIGQNTRLPHIVLGDLRSCIAAFHAAHQLFSETVQTYGEAAVQGFFSEAIAYSEGMLRRMIRELPNGTYRFVDWLDDSVVQSEPLRIEVELTVEDETLCFDFSGSSAQVDAAINSTLSYTKSAVYAAVRTLLPNEVPNNGGLFRPISITAPSGTIVHAREPAAVAQRGVTGSRVVNAALGVLAQAVPDRVPAADEGGVSSVRISGHDSNHARFVVWDSVVGTWGGRPDRDGIDGCSNFAANVANASVEIIESEYPLRILQYGLKADSGGAGRHRGGMGLIREWELLEGKATFIMRSDRTKFAPWGLAGGLDGSHSSTTLNRGGEITRLPAKFELEIHAGDRILHEQASGGGYGDPLERDPRLVVEDWRNERVTLAQARKVYGVVISDGVLREDQTAHERQQRNANALN